LPFSEVSVLRLGQTRIACGQGWRDAGVATVPGAAFGTDGFFRISFATSMENLELSMRRIERACEALQVAG
jgi:aspartate/methionine/tyrosine aminotransferase